jgi:tRNA pseudouridine32 synthase/23S rRNA pseudouridine746 synthase
VPLPSLTLTFRGVLLLLAAVGSVILAARSQLALPDLVLPVVVRNHVRKERGSWQAEVVPGAPVNAETLVELESEVDARGIYRLTPRTGRTHQLRVHLHGLGIPIVDDPLYPEVLDVEVDDFRRPLQLLAGRVAFTDPVDGRAREFHSVRRIPLTAEG